MNTNAQTITPGAAPVTTDKLMADLRVLAADMEQLLAATASQTGRRAAAARATARESLAAIRTRVAGLQDVARERSHAAVRATDAYAHDNPWQLMAIGAAAGLAAGIAIARCGTGDDRS
jgi:ElaB/YqjD/DUF883 family membrane-anchored ribosome-binding protein